MFGISLLEFLVIGVLALVVLGPEKLPEVARWAGKGVRELRQMSNTLRDALLIDDLSGTSRSNQRPQNSARPLPTPTPPQRPSRPPGPGAQMNEPLPSDYSEAPMGLDQFDDAHFDQMLEEHYRLHHHNEVRRVPLGPAHPSIALSAVTLPARRTDDTALFPVTIPPSLSPDPTA